MTKICTWPKNAIFLTIQVIPLGDPSYPESLISDFVKYPEVAEEREGRLRGFGLGMNLTKSPAGNKPSSFVR